MTLPLNIQRKHNGTSHWGCVFLFYLLIRMSHGKCQTAFSCISTTFTHKNPWKYTAQITMSFVEFEGSRTLQQSPAAFDDTRCCKFSHLRNISFLCWHLQKYVLFYCSMCILRKDSCHLQHKPYACVDANVVPFSTRLKYVHTIHLISIQYCRASL